MRVTRSKSLHIFVVAILSLAVFLVAGCNEQGDSSAIDSTVTRNPSPSAPNSLAPHLAITPGGNAVLSWLEPTGADGHAVSFSVLRENSWSSPTSVAQSDNWFVNYADFPSVVPITENHWAAHWLTRQPGGDYAYDIAMSISADGGVTWATPFTPHDDGTLTEHGFVTIFRWSDAMGMVWLDGRNTSPDVTSSASPAADSDASMPATNDAGGMALRYARLDFQGQEIAGGILDERVCDCCQTDVAMTSEGPIVSYRDRSPTEIRDISVVRHVDGGWSEPVTISDDQWQIAACPVNGPAVAAEGANVIVAWYAAPESQSRVKVAWSSDAGQTFSAPLVIEDGSVSGRVDVALIDTQTAVVSWVGRTEDGVAQVRMRDIGINGNDGPVRVVAEGDFSRGTGFPQMINTGSQLVFAWPEAGETRRVHTGFTMLKSAASP